MPTRRTLLGWGAGAAVAIAAGAAAWRTQRPRDGQAFIDAAGRNVRAPSHVRRVFAAGPPASVLIYAVAPERLLGWPRAPSEDAKAFLAAPYRDLPALGALTGRAATANLERVVALAPDLIVDCGEIDRTYVSLADRMQQQIGAPYVLLDGAFDASADTLRTAGRLLEAEQQGERLGAYAEDILARVGSFAQRPASDRVRVYYGRGSEGLETGRAGAITTELIDRMAVNVAASGGAGGLTNVSPEQILAWDPDVIIAHDRRFRAALSSDPRWVGLRAVREGRLYLQPALPFGWIDAPPGVNRLLGALWLQSILTGADQDLADEVRGFYELFYHVQVSADQIVRLLQGGAGGR